MPRSRVCLQGWRAPFVGLVALVGSGGLWKSCWFPFDRSSLFWMNLRWIRKGIESDSSPFLESWKVCLIFSKGEWLPAPGLFSQRKALRTKVLERNLIEGLVVDGSLEKKG